jgi:hypothetical protein
VRKLYQIGDDLSALEELLTDIDGEIPEGEIGTAIEEWFDAIGHERDNKIRNYCALIEMMGFNADACEEEARRLGKLKRANENGARRLKERLQAFFEQHGIQKLDLGAFRPRIQANGGQAPLIVPQTWATEPASAPEAFHKITVELNTPAIREALTEGRELCPECGESVVHVNSYPPYDKNEPLAHSDAIPIVLCEICHWAGEPHETARIGERGRHLKLR